MLLDFFSVCQDPDDGPNSGLVKDLLMPEQQVRGRALGGRLEPSVDVLHEQVLLLHVQLLDDGFHLRLLLHGEQHFEDELGGRVLLLLVLVADGGGGQEALEGLGVLAGGDQVVDLGGVEAGGGGGGLRREVLLAEVVLVEGVHVDLAEGVGGGVLRHCGVVLEEHGLEVSVGDTPQDVTYQHSGLPE